MGRKKGSIGHPRINEQKWCFVCQEYKDASQFYLDTHQWDGLDSRCKSCKFNYYKDYLRNYYLKHREDLLPKHRQSAKMSILRRK